MASTKAAYQYDYSGACSPRDAGYTMSCKTFSVGIFQWVPTANGKGLKKSAVVSRIKGSVSDPEDVYRRAEAKCQELQKAYLGILA